MVEERCQVIDPRSSMSQICTTSTNWATSIHAKIEQCDETKKDYLQNLDKLKKKCKDIKN